MSYDPKTQTAIDSLRDFTTDDFARLALACLDQAGLSVRDHAAVTERVETMLDMQLNEPVMLEDQVKNAHSYDSTEPGVYLVNLEAPSTDENCPGPVNYILITHWDVLQAIREGRDTVPVGTYEVQVTGRISLETAQAAIARC